MRIPLPLHYFPCQVLLLAKNAKKAASDETAQLPSYNLFPKWGKLLNGKIQYKLR
ncbi:hypothetical protein D3C81_2084090 [compost metagenome]